MKTNLQRYFALTLLVIASQILSSCDSFVEDTHKPFDSISDVQLDSESEVGFLISGVQTRFAHTYAFVSVYAGGLSDELVYTELAPGATWPEYREIDAGNIPPSSFQMEDLSVILGELRFYADDLLERLDRISFSDPDLENEARFVSNFYGGVARYFYATYWGLDPTNGGGVISASASELGSFIPSMEMYDLAGAKLNAAMAFASTSQAQFIQTLLARIALFQGDYEAARTAASNGMREGSPPFEALFSLERSNAWLWEAGVRRAHLVTDDRYVGYLNADPSEVGRILLAPTPSFDGSALFVPGFYPQETSTIPFLTWQENELILAEIEIRTGDEPSALSRINQVRASHGVSPATSATLEDLIVERDKELFAKGMRLPDQRRFDIWHLGAGTWQYLPIALTERSQNPNL